MPIGTGDAYEVYLNRYTNIIRPAVEDYEHGGSRIFDAVRADFITSTGSINKSVIQHIYNADLVIADLTDLNPNVFYELGVRHALRNGTLLVALEGTKLPFDVGDLRSVFYKDRVGAEKESIPEIQRLIRALVEDESADDSPVFAVLPSLQAPQTRDLKEAQAKASAAQADAAELRVKLGLAEDANLRLRESFTTFERTINAVLDRMKPNDREAAEEAVERAAKARADQPRKVPSQLPGVEENPTQVFVLMPFSAELEPVYEIIKEASQRAGLRATRADEMMGPGKNFARLSDAIARAGLVVADITGWNDYILFGMGVADSLGKSILIISQKGEHIPFDIFNQRVIVYENKMGAGEFLREQLTAAMRDIVEGAAQ
jgi:hypothetical protein